jgi:phage-related protein
VGIGREVADAYIDVHGDLSSFRRDLQKADGDMRAAAFEAADNFSDAWAKRIQSDVNGKWGGIVDAMYSEKQIDWDRMFGQFDARSISEARDQVKEFLNVMRQTEQWGKDEEGEPVFEGMKLDIEEAAKMLSRMDEVIAGMRRRDARDAKREAEREDHARRLIGLQQDLTAAVDKHKRVQKVLAEAEEEAHRDNAAWMERRKKTMEEAIAMNKAWARTWEGMRKNNAIKDLDADFKRLSEAMNFTDMAKFAKSFDSLIKARSRIYDVTAAMREQGRISDERAAELHEHFQAFMDDENAKSKMMKEALEETKRLKKAQDDYNTSLRGMAQAFHTADMEAKFRQLATAIESNDWSGIARGAKNMEELRNRTMETANEMHRLGRMTDQELAMVEERFERVTANARKFNVEFKEARNNGTSFGTTMRNVLTRTSNLFTRLGNITRGFREHIGGFAGLNVFGDMLRKGLDFIHNLDRIALSLGKNTILLSTMAAVGTSAFAGLVTLGADLGAVIGGLAVALPAFVVGAGIGIGVLIAAMKDMETVLADLKPAFAELQNQISSSFWTEAAGPIREMVATLMPILTPKLKGTATALGGLVGKLAKAFRDIPADALNTMFDRMNSAIDILGNAMPPLVRAFTTLGIVGSKYFERFSTWLVKLTDQFDAFIQRSAANGDLDRWINDMIEGFKNIGRAIDGAMGIFNALNSAAKRAGFGGLKTFADSLQRAADIMNTPAFQNTLTIYFDGARDLAMKLGQAIADLGPAFESFAPTANIALNNVGDTVKRLIGYVGEIFTNPTFQKGVQDFTGSLATAVDKLQPAIKPFGDSLGQALSLLGQIAVAVAEVAAAFFVHLSPALDSMSAKFSTLIDPLKNTVINFLQEMEGPLKALDEQFVGPLVTAFNEKLLPAINGFIDEFGPFAEKVITDLGPAFKILVDDVLPNFVRLATELLTPLGSLIDLLSPLLATTLERIGSAFSNLADSIKVLKGELPITELFIFKAMDPAKIKSDAEAAKQEVADNMSGRASTTDWGQVISDIFWGQRPDVFWSRVYSLLGPNDKNNAEFAKSMNELGTVFEGMRQGIVDDWNEIWSGEADRKFTDIMIEWFPGQADFLNGVQGWTDDVFSGKWFGEAKTNIETMWNDTWKEGGNVDQMEATVNGWMNTNVFEPFGRAMDSIGKIIPESFKSDVSEWGLIPAIVNWFNNSIGAEIGKGFTDGWKNIAEGRWGSSPEGAAKWEGFWAQWNEWWSDDGTVGDINTTVNEWFENSVFKPLRDAWDTAWKSVTDWLNGGAVTSEGSSEDHGKQFWDTFWGGFGGMMGDANTWAEGINTTVNTWLEDNVWTPVREWVDDLDWAKIGEDLWNGFIEGITGKDPDTWNKIKEGFTGWVEDMKTFFGIASPSTLMLGFAGDIVQGFLNGFGDFVGKVGAKWEEIKTGVIAKFEELKAGLAEKWEGFQTGWNDFWGGVGTTLGEKWEGFKTTVGTKWEELKSGLDAKWGEFKAGWDGFWADTGTNLSTAWEGFKTTVGTKAGEIKTGVDTWATDFGNGWNGFWGDTGKNLGTAWDGFVGTTKDKAGEIKTGVDSFGRDVKTNWDGFWGGVGKTLTDKWGEFTGTTSKKSGEIEGDVNDMAGNVKGDWQSMLSQMNDQINSSFQNFVNTVSGKVGEIISWVAGMPGKIAGAVGGLGNLLWSAGSAIMGGFLSGLQSQWGGITSFVGSIADWIASHKGPLSYDRTLLEPAGEAIMLGLQRGLESRMDPLLNTLQSITDAVTDSVSADLSKSKMYVTGRDAAQGLADGLKANRTSVHTALSNLGAFTAPASQVMVSGAFPSVGRPTEGAVPGRSVTIAEGAIKVITPTKNPELVAAKVMDSFANFSNF